MLNLRINIPILYMTCCVEPNIKKIQELYVCLNCLYSTPTINKKSDDCCDNPNINSKGICINCGTIHQIFTNKLEFQDNDAYETNVLFKLKKVHNPYKYLKKNYPEIKDKKIYDFILESIQFIQDFYKLKRKPFTKYVPYLYNFYRENDESIPELYEIEKDLILEKEIIDKLNELTNNKNKSKFIKQKNDKIFDSRYYYFNKSKNEYFKKSRYCSYNDCYKIANFKDTWNDKKYCKNHIDDDADVININNKTNIKKCKYNNCKKSTKNDYCQNHNFKCNKNNCNIRILTENYFCSNHKK